MVREFAIDLEQETTQLAEQIAPLIKKGDILALYGDLGSGKTFFTRQLCRVLGVADLVTSPSFVLINQYQSPHFNIYHIDLYRLHDENDLWGLGIDEFIEDGVTIIEWPELAEPLLNKQVIKLYFEYTVRGRRVKIESNEALLSEIN